MFIVCYRMEELVTLYYGNFSILGEWVREFAQRTSCSNQVADWTLWNQLSLTELHREHLGWNTAPKLEWGLFLLEHMLHNTANMWRKEHWRCSWGSQLEMAELAPEHPSVQTLLGTPDEEILKVAEQVYRREHAVVPSVLPCRQLWHLCSEQIFPVSWPGACADFPTQTNHDVIGTLCGDVLMM